MAAILPAADALQASLPPNKLARAQAAAQDFEAMALGELLEPMFETVDVSKDPFSGGEAEATWRPILVQEMAEQIARHGGLGLARPVLEQMIRMQEQVNGGGRR